MKLVRSTRAPNQQLRDDREAVLRAGGTLPVMLAALPSDHDNADYGHLPLRGIEVMADAPAAQLTLLLK